MPGHLSQLIACPLYATKTHKIRSKIKRESKYVPTCPCVLTDWGIWGGDYDKKKLSFAGKINFNCNLQVGVETYSHNFDAIRNDFSTFFPRRGHFIQLQCEPCNVGCYSCRKIRRIWETKYPIHLTFFPLLGNFHWVLLKPAFRCITTGSLLTPWLAATGQISIA